MENGPSIDVQAPVADVWAAVTDVGRWHEWDPHVERVVGRSMPDLQPSFDAHVAGLKAHVEG